RIGQTLALMNGKEIYTKKGLIDFYPELKSMLDRVENTIPGFDGQILNKYRDMLLKEMQQVSVIKKGDFHIFYVKPGVEITNLYGYQSRGLVIDCVNDQLLH